MVTGIRFKIFDGTLYIQMQVGQIGSWGQVTNATWIDPPINKTNRVLLSNFNAIDFDEVLTDPGWVITGTLLISYQSSQVF